MSVFDQEAQDNIAAQNREARAATDAVKVERRRLRKILIEDGSNALARDLLKDSPRKRTSTIPSCQNKPHAGSATCPECP